MAPQLSVVDRLRIQQSHAEQRALHLADELHDTKMALLESQQRVHVTSEPLTYRRGGEHSLFLDAARAARMGSKAARTRIERHEKEMEAELPKHRAARDRAAQAAYERAFYSTPADRRALDAMLAAGVDPFERRAISRQDGSGGYLTIPLYLVDEYVGLAREAAPFASAWTPMDLPAATSEINIPRLAVGTAAGPLADTAAVGSRDLADSLVSAGVKTIAGYADASLQWLDQGGGSAGFGVDEMIFRDLTADIATNTDGQCLLGVGAGTAQLLGVWPAGAIAAANGIVVADTQNATGQTWTVSSAAPSLHVSAAQLVSLSRRIRARSEGWAWFWHPWLWSLYTATVDSQGRPLVLDQDCDLPDGVLGYYQNIPVHGDTNIPTTFGGTSPPTIGPLTNGQYAAIPGTGGAPNYTPLLLARPDDLFLFSGEIQVRVLREVLSGTGRVRFEATQYLAAMPNRYVAATAVGSTVAALGNVSVGTLTWNVTNSLLQLASSGY